MSTPNEAYEQEQPARENALLVFLDCDRCDFDYLRQEILFVNYVRDRNDAQVHVLVTDEPSGGGRRYIIDFIGLAGFADRDVSYSYSASNTDTDDETRAGLAQVLRVGFLHYVIETPLAGQIEIGTGERELGQRAIMAQPEDDPWDFWVFRFSSSARASGEDTRKERRFNGSASANRTTEKWIIKAEISTAFRENVTELSSGLFKDVRSSYDVDGQIVRSLGEHWGASIRGGLSGSTYLNQDQLRSFLSGIEFNVFPYSEYSRRSLTLNYQVGSESFDYDRETIFGKLEETRGVQELESTFDVEQPWGDSRIRFRYKSYLDDFNKYNLSLYGNLSFRIVRGLSVFTNASTSLVRDQIYLTVEDLSDEEILIQRRQLATDSRYRILLGFSYTFGSIFNNVVNPRF